ncbi:hypothetical protein CI102_14520 [Trichoderma harzianum]|nr:hypothetical protein CI102_14520 [Trichoderma harzianum]
MSERHCDWACTEAVRRLNEGAVPSKVRYEALPRKTAVAPVLMTRQYRIGNIQVQQARCRTCARPLPLLMRSAQVPTLDAAPLAHVGHTYIPMYECPMCPYNFKYKKRVHQLPIISLYRVLCRPVPLPTRRRNKPHLVYPSILVFCPGFDSTAPTWNQCNRYRVQEQARVLSKLRSCWCSDPTISRPHICN